MIDSIRAEIDYRQDRVRRDVAGARGDTATDKAEDRPAGRRGDERRSGRSAGRRVEPPRPAVPRQRAHSGVR